MADQPDATPKPLAVDVEQSLAIAVQDATDFMRSAMTLAIGTFGAGVAQYLASGDNRYLEACDRSESLLSIASNWLQFTIKLAGRAPPQD